MAKQKKIDDGSAEQKIKEAARKLFTERGFDAVKTRDIAAEAGINLALLNYYFRSKQKLFDIIMMENFQQFVQQLIPILSNDALTLDETIAQAASSYIDMLRSNPDLPFFIMNEMKNNAARIEGVKAGIAQAREGFLKRIEQAMNRDRANPVNMHHFMINFMGMVIFPFVARSAVMRINGFTQKDFDTLMEERKRLVPIWLKAMMFS